MSDFRLDKHARNDVEIILKALLEICQICHTPMFGCVVTKIGKDIEYNNIVYSSQSHQIRLFSDNVRKHMLVANGFEVIPPTNAEPVNIESQKKKITEYLLEADQLHDIMTALNNVEQLADKYKTAVFATVAIENKDGKTIYETKISIPDEPIFNRDNQIYKHKMISEKSFDAVPVRDALSLDMGEVLIDDGA